MLSMKVVGVLAGALLLAGATAMANPQNHGDRDKEDRSSNQPDERTTRQSITINTENGEIKISSVLIITDTAEVLGALTETGVRRHDEDKVDLSGLPLIGGLFGGETSAPVRIGDAHILGPTLLIDLASPSDGRATSVSDLPPPTPEERVAIGRSMDARIREIMALGLPPVDLIHHVERSALLIEQLQVRSQKNRQTMPASSLGRIGLLGSDAPPERPINAALLEEIRAFERLLGMPDATTYLEERNLTVAIPERGR